MNSNKFVVFDCGGVVGSDMKYSFVKNHVATHYPEKSAQAELLLNKQLWSRIRVDATYTDRQYFEDFVKQLDIPSDQQLIEQFMLHTKQELYAFKPPLQVAFDLHHRSISTYILSNHGKDWFNYIYDSEALFKAAFPDKEKLVVSYQVGYYKPQQEIFQSCWDIMCKYESTHNNKALQLSDKSKVLFIDDKIDNINAAKTFGWQAYQFNFNIEPVEKLSIAIEHFLAN
ncbi:hypothetical protein PPL_10830 [Heterostelium album PN500]|uniref:Uncharacterized protein n=1 Tax=Heterostelium pallidum (strain ATCC 26659 / Pp 5 / PN500) TaxID=670386 RepID=D3BS38_HETP5|nr:hypothetical protein PPL_10830 [Heterostelium album PN500]EFA75775.1 hypothetical protein PPL_10830 [Heterostelium album PN500]|eukprot:XP_020427909.1 hypothetical protein PPL_10830 [Heterostelium album PN500]